MMQVNVAEAKKDLSRLIRLVETNREPVITIARNGAPVVKIVPADRPPVTNRIGIAKGKFKAPEDFDANNAEIYEMLAGGPLI
ncbi:MAG: type II toxin-antitoxin system prevent-host-death family antitoxin [Eubacteriales bacterium]|nr:type II toxin-antitoxin system prevent-host-death family antitoxin [Eubacteriales bacterium]